MLKKLAILYLIGIIGFLWGGAAMKYGVFPGKIISTVSHDIEVFMKGDAEGSKLSIETAVGSHFSSIPLKHLKRKSHNAESAMRKITAMGRFPESLSGQCLKVATSYNNSLAILLIGDNTDVLHHWNVDYDRVFGTQGVDNEIDINGSLVLPDGSVIVNYTGYNGMARIDADGKVMWKIDDHRLHHSVTLTKRNTLWVPGREMLKKPRLGQPAGREEDLFYEIDAESGNILRKIYTVDILVKNSLHGLYEWIISEDKLHVNDIEEVGEEFAASNKRLGIKSTDVIATAKRMNMVYIVDPDTLDVKWFSHYPWNQPHDPDPLPDGSFLIFDNNQSKGKPSRRWGTSRILKIYPGSKKYDVVYSSDWFHSNTRSDQQLHGDNLLITADNPAYVFNVSNGVVNYWYINQYNEKKNWYVEDAEWISQNFFTNPELNKACTHERTN